MPSAKPSKPLSGADFSALVKKVNELAGKVPGVSPLSATATGRIPLWKRWVSSEGPEYAATEDGGLRAVVKANAEYLDAVKHDVDNHTERLDTQAARISALENAPAVPFPGSG